MPKHVRDYDTRDMSDRCQRDAFLRTQGYRIACRPNEGEPVWIKNGVHFLESDLMQRLEPAPCLAAAELPEVIVEQQAVS